MRELLSWGSSLVGRKISTNIKWNLCILNDGYIHRKEKIFEILGKCQENYNKLMPSSH